MLTAVISIITGTIVLSSIFVYVSNAAYINSKINVNKHDIPIPFNIFIGLFSNISLKISSPLNSFFIHFYSYSYKLFSFRIGFNYKR